MNANPMKKADPKNWWAPPLKYGSVLTLLCVLTQTACDKAQVNQSPPGAPTPILSQQVDGGDWNSGGGYSMTDQFNPWFIQNTKEVTYCIEIDEKNFGQSLTRSRELIEEAFAYWKDEFALARPVVNEGDNEQVILGGQTFKYVGTGCAPDVDLRFQLGVLTPEQKEHLKNPKEWVGHAARTSYDPVQLKGRGFIYISPISGEFALDRKDLLENRWRVANGLLLKLVLIHELGHPFGMTFTEHPIMNSRLLGAMTSNTSTNVREPKNQLPHFFNLHPFVDWTRCRGEDASLLAQRDNPFGVTDEVACVRLVPERPDPNYAYGNLYIELQKQKSDPFVRAGAIMDLTCFTSLKQQGWLYLSSEQKVFKNPRQKQFYYIITSSHSSCVGKFIPAGKSQESKPFYWVNVSVPSDMADIEFSGETLNNEYRLRYLIIPAL